MKVVVHIYPSSSGPNRRSEAKTLEIPCGSGEQLIRWLGHAACLKLDYVRRDVTRKNLPQAVVGKDGTVLDADHVLKEVIADGDEVYVEYGPGPKAFSTRWEGRADTPEFNWGDDGVVQPAIDLWLRQLDLLQENVDQLIDAEANEQDAAAVTRDLAAVKELLCASAGGLQACFVVYEFQGEKDPRTVSRMDLTQFKAFAAAAGVCHGKFNADRLDDVFTAVAASPAALRRKLDAAATSTMNFADFVIALCHLAYHRFAALKADLARHTLLSDKLDDLLTECVAKHLYGDIGERVAKFAAPQPKAVAAMLAKGRRLTEQTLDSCQMKRCKAADAAVELKHVACHMAQWRLLGHDVPCADFAYVVLHAKHASRDVAGYALLQQPLTLGYDEFETVLLDCALHMAEGRRRGGGGFDDYLGTVMDRVFRTSGVLLDMPAD